MKKRKYRKWFAMRGRVNTLHTQADQKLVRWQRGRWPSEVRAPLPSHAKMQGKCWELEKPCVTVNTWLLKNMPGDRKQ